MSKNNPQLIIKYFSFVELLFSDWSEESEESENAHDLSAVSGHKLPIRKEKSSEKKP